MTQKSIKGFIDEIFSKLPKKYYLTNKTDVYHFDGIWTLDILDLKDYGPENNRGYRYVLLVIDNFSKFGFTKPLQNKNSRTKKDFRKYFDKFKTKKPNLIETDRGNKFYNGILQIFFKKKT